MSVFFPSLMVKSITQVTVEMLEEYRIQGLIIDIDNTLTHHNSPHISPEINEWIKNVQNIYPIILLSNNNEGRVKPFAEQLGLPFIANGAKPLPGQGFQKAVDYLGLPPSRVAMIGDQLFTDVLVGNLGKATTILVEPMHQEKNAFFHLKRFFEELVLKQYVKKKGR